MLTMNATKFLLETMAKPSAMPIAAEADTARPGFLARWWANRAEKIAMKRADRFFITLSQHMADDLGLDPMGRAMPEPKREISRRTLVAPTGLALSLR